MNAPVERILVWAICVGAVSFVAGFFGPLFFSKSNLDPLLGVFVTGPLGILAGALVGALSVAKESGRLSIACVGSVWAMTLLYTFLCFGLSAWIGLPAIPLQFLVVASTIFLFYRRDTRAQLPDGMRRCGPIVVAALMAVLLMTVFPPVIKPWWGLAGGQPDTAASLPSFAFILDGRFNASQHIPQFAVNRGALAREWAIAAVLAAGLCLLMRVPRRRRLV